MRSGFQSLTKHFEAWMAIKRVGDDVEPEASIRLWCWNWNKDHVKMDFDRTIVSNDNGWEYGGFVK
jgi:hypothetical protein